MLKKDKIIIGIKTHKPLFRIIIKSIYADKRFVILKFDDDLMGQFIQI